MKQFQKENTGLTHWSSNFKSREKLTKTAICRKHRIPISTLSTILDNREKTEKAKGESRFLQNTKKMKHASHEDMEAAWFARFKQAHTLNVLVSGPILMEKASEISKSMGLDFIPNGGWLECGFFFFNLELFLFFFFFLCLLPW